MKRYTKVESYPDLVRDNATGALININSSKIKSAKERLKKLKQKNEEIDQLKNDVSDIKKMLHQLLEKNSNG